MNTKQKLTLGIAAIFMVTLTIVGVTYAYFVTQVAGDGNTTDVNVQTAKFGALEYVPGNNKDENGDAINAVELSNAFPGDTKTFNYAVKNTGEAGAQALNYKLTLEVTPDTNTASKHQFFHSATTPATDGTVVDACYEFTADYDANGTSDLDGDATPTGTPVECLGGEYYDNIIVTIWESDSTYTTKNKKVDQKLLDVNDTFTTSRVKNDSSYTITDTITIEPGDTNMHYYILEVEYVDAQKNQNYETEAALTIKPNIVPVYLQQ